MSPKSISQKTIKKLFALSGNLNVLENLKRETTNEPIKYWLSGVIKCLMKKIGEY